MWRKTMIALLATAALLAPGCASARGFGGGGFHGGGGFGGFHGGGGWHGGGGFGGWHGGSVAAFRGMPMGGNVAFHHVGMVGVPHFVPGFHHGFGFRRHVFVGGVGFVGPYYYGDDYPYYGYPDQVYYDDGYVDTGCALVRQRVLTPYGWQIRTVQICQ